jgi:inosine/xanthosine triphosphatase
MIKIVLTSTNSAKKQAVKDIAQKIFNSEYELICVDVESNVSPTPFSSEECMQGAINRIKEAKKQIEEADFWIGAEGGLHKFSENYFLGGWILIENRAGVQSWGSSAWVQMPNYIMKSLTTDKRLNEVLDYSKFNSELLENKSSLGTNGLLTKGNYTRVDEFKDALRIAFSQII